MPSFATSCTTALFADDSKCFKQISSTIDCILLQNDLNRFSEWSKLWNMSFNASKCKVLSITRSRHPIHYDYQLNGVSLDHVGSFKDLGVIFNERLSFTSHIESIISKSNKMCGIVKRSLGFHAPCDVKLQLYKSLCRSNLEYSTQVWSPHCRGEIKSIESVQRSITRYMLPDSELSYTERCQSLDLMPLTFHQ